MTFSNSLELLAFHGVVYSIYSLLIISIIAWFAYNLTRKEKVKSIVRIPFYGYIAFLVIGGVGHHIFTYNAIPWVSEDIMRDSIKPDKVFKFGIENHKWKLPKEEIIINCGEKVLFSVESKDLMYGFGLFRQDGTMVTQMQVNPHSENDLLWTFNHNGVFDLISTEYSGPRQYDENGTDLMRVNKLVKVIGCKEDGGKK
jgi:cytochrome c oxidase subunit 2